ncbi:methyltransferase N6AMT1-like [Gordionus sp. m RMFG-2023]|uniref:methyltransferase N6AMT1-like n=1 Tax=Gordionus sp. m RMFG-2023 TaxID=3053472 RepID=UPI0031FDF904
MDFLDFKLPTPIYKFDKNDLQHIYEPSEDTFLFMDALELEKSFIKTLEPTIILEIGSGSGVLTTFLALNFDLDNTHFMATDINPLACVKTSETIHLNYSQLPLKVKRPKVSIFIDDLAQSIIDRLNYNIDMIIFNPPYVPTHDITDNGQSGDFNIINRSWAGGLNGSEIIFKSLDNITRLLTHNGIFYLLLCADNDIDNIKNYIKNKFHFNSCIVLKRRAINEILYIVKFYKTHPFM